MNFIDRAFREKIHQAITLSILIYLFLSSYELVVLVKSGRRDENWVHVWKHIPTNGVVTSHVNVFSVWRSILFFVSQVVISPGTDSFRDIVSGCSVNESEKDWKAIYGHIIICNDGLNCILVVRERCTLCAS